MLISYPILMPPQANETEDQYLERFIQTYAVPHEGAYPVSSLVTRLGVEHHWHGGIHLQGLGEPIRAIADGTVVAFRLASAIETYPGQGDYDTSFVLIRHETQTGENTTVLFYSLYMHLSNRASLTPDRFQQLPRWLRHAQPGANVQNPTNVRVWRKEVLGFAGQLYGRERCHFEIFTTQEGLNGFWRDSTATTRTGSNDFYGDAHFVLPPQQVFRDRHPRAAASGPHRIAFQGNNHFSLPTGQAGTSTERLFVSVSFREGRRIATTYRTEPTGGYRQLGQPVDQDNYEYELYRMATALYPDCPSAGLEWLRFGRVLGGETTARNENWQLIRYAQDAIGYVDLAPTAIVKLSDADFPYWHGWELRDEGQTASASDGLCDDPSLITLAAATDELSRRRVRKLICKHPTEWDSADLANRYARHRAAGQSLNSIDAWQRFEQHVQRLSFWTQTNLPRSIWHFHPLQLINHFRRCGWLTRDELAQCIPRQNLHLTGTAFHSQLVATWGAAIQRAGVWALHLNRATRKYCIANTKQRLLHFFSQLIEESGYYRAVVEGQGPQAGYAPYYGRGLIQLTHRGNYERYGEFRSFATLHPVQQGAFISLGWDPDILIAQTNTNYNSANCADSAAFYWTCPEITAIGLNLLRTSDGGLGLADVIQGSRATNGNVPQQNINGLATRLQAFVFGKHVLLDATLPQAATEQITFDWRRNSAKEQLFHPNGQPVLDARGRPRRAYILGRHTINVPLGRQLP